MICGLAQKISHVLHIATGTKVTASATQHHRLDLLVLGEFAENLPKFFDHLETHRIPNLRPVQAQFKPLIVLDPLQGLHHASATWPQPLWRISSWKADCLQALR
jgi:hypothetical protein